MHHKSQKEIFRREEQVERQHLLKSFLADLVENAIGKGLQKLSITGTGTGTATAVPQRKFAKLEICKSFTFGHYACTSAMDREFRNLFIHKDPKFANPLYVAEWLAKCLKGAVAFSLVKVAAPGFVNLTLNTEVLLQRLQMALEKDDQFGCLASSPASASPTSASSASASPTSASSAYHKSKMKSILLEFVSANPTGPLNIVSARAAAIGDSLANLLQAIGHRIVKEFYINDYGNQIRLLGLSFALRYLERHGHRLRFLDSPKEKQETTLQSAADGKPALEEKTTGVEIIFPQEGYRGDYLVEALQEVLESFEKENLKNAKNEKNEKNEKNPKNSKNIGNAKNAKNVDSQIEQVPVKKILTSVLASVQNQKNQAGSSSNDCIDGEKLVAAESCDLIGKFVSSFFHQNQRKDLRKFRVHFDSFVFESDMHKKNKITPLLARLKDNLEKCDGKIIFQSSKISSDDKDRVLMRADGRPTYFLSDLAYHNDKTERNHNVLIDILGPDHHGYVERMRAGLQALGFAGDFIALITQQVNLLRKDKVVKMSKRSGTFVKLAELQKKLPIDVLRFFFLERAASTHMDFDYEMATNTTEKNPYYYIAYAHARICSIMQRVESLEENLADAPTTPGQPGVSTEQATPTTPTTPGQQGAAWFMTQERQELLFAVCRYPEEMYDAATNLEPHRFLKFLYQMAQMMSQFYVRPENRILEKQGMERLVLLELIAAVRICLRNGLNLLGMHAPEKL